LRDTELDPLEQKDY
jgi:hypothetical protein